jgi:hypothetical protein
MFPNSFPLGAPESDFGRLPSMLSEKVYLAPISIPSIICEETLALSPIIMGREMLLPFAYSIDNKNHLPNHLAIIMDGNGRWAEQKGKKRIFGHKNGIKAVQKVVEEAVELKIRYLTLYAFSTENWNRPREEIGVLMKLLVNSLKNEFENFLRIELN